MTFKLKDLATSSSYKDLYEVPDGDHYTTFKKGGDAYL